MDVNRQWMCLKTSIKSVLLIELFFFLAKFTVDSDCDCPINCETVSFSYQLSSSSFPSRHILPILVKRINASAAVNGSEEFYEKVQTKLR